MDDLGATEGYPALTMFDKEGKTRIALNLSGLPVGDLKVSKEGGVPASEGETVWLDGGGNGGSLWLNDESRKESIGLGVSAPNAASGFLGTAQLRLEADVPNLFLGRGSGYHTEIGSTNLVIPLTGTTQRTSAASAVLFNHKGNVIWSAP
jgi:hypothetical protein